MVVRGLMCWCGDPAAEAAVAGAGVCPPLLAAGVVTLGKALNRPQHCGGHLSNKFDQSGDTNFIVVPLSLFRARSIPFGLATFHGGAYARSSRVFYLIDGARYGMIGQSDAAPWLGLAVVLAALLACSTLCWHWLRTGYRLKP